MFWVRLNDSEEFVALIEAGQNLTAILKARSGAETNMKTFTFAPFDQLYDALALAPPQNLAGWESERLFEPGTAFWLGSEGVTPRPPISLWYKRQDGPTPDSLRRTIRSWLGTGGHAISDNLVTVTLAFSIGLHRDYGGPTGFFSELKKLLVTADVRHTAVVQHSDQPLEGRFNYAGFAYGPLDGARLAYECKKAGSTAKFAGFITRLGGQPSLESPNYKRELFDLATLCWRKKGSPEVQLLGELLEQYFQELARAHIEMMWADLERAMLIPAALTGRLVDFSQLKEISGVCYVSTYRNFGVEHSHGHVGLQNPQPRLAIPKPSFAEKKVGELESLYKLSELSSSPFQVLIEGIARSISRSWYHADAGRLDEAFLFMIIALEQVFSERTATTQAVASRTAVVAHQAIGKPYGDALSYISRLYDKRSRFVHNAAAVEYEDFENAHEVSIRVLEVLLRFSRDRDRSPSEVPQAVHSEWLRKIDFIKAAIEAGENIDEVLLRKCGISKA